MRFAAYVATVKSGAVPGCSRWMAIPSAETKRSRTSSHKRGVRLSLLYARKHRHFIKEKEKNRVYWRANNKLVAHKGLQGGRSRPPGRASCARRVNGRGAPEPRGQRGGRGASAHGRVNMPNAGTNWAARHCCVRTGATLSCWPAWFVLRCQRRPHTQAHTLWARRAWSVVPIRWLALDPTAERATDAWLPGCLPDP